MTLSSTKMTAKQYLMLGEDPPGVRLELVDGEIIVSPSPSEEHSSVDRQLTAILVTYVNQNDLGILLGDLDTIFGEFDVRRPDILFISKARNEQRERKGHGIRIAPDLCVEIVSPGSATMDRVNKFELYAKHGVPNYWLVDPETRTFLAYRLIDGQYELAASARGTETIKAPPFEALEIPLGRLWLPR